MNPSARFADDALRTADDEIWQTFMQLRLQGEQGDLK